MNKDKIRELINTEYKEQYENEESMFSMFVDHILEAEVITEEVVLDVVNDITKIAASNLATLSTITNTLRTMLKIEMATSD